MFGLSVLDIVAVCNGKLSSSKHLNDEILRIVIDSRSARMGDLFVAYKGEKVDGHDFIVSAFNNGATAALAEHEIDGCDFPVIVVDDVQTALETIIQAFRMAIDCPIIGVTGSVGKTTTKEMIASVLSTCANVCKTEKNFNNLIGVPMSLSQISEEHDVAVIEMGISIPGEMARLSKMVRPGIMVFTSIGHAHLEFLGDLPGVFKEKTAVINYMYDNSTIIANGDDPYLSSIKCKQHLILFGTSDNCDVRAENIIINEKYNTSFDIVYKSRVIHIDSSAYGRHMVNASLAAASVGFIMGLSDDQIKNGILNYQVVGRRGLVENTGFITLVDDSYNSNLDSCKMALLSLMDLPGRHVAILGDFLEQGDYGPQQHKEIGEYASEIGVEEIIGIGEYGQLISTIHYLKNTDVINDLDSLIRPGDNVLVKASQGVHLDIVSEALKTINI